MRSLVLGLLVACGLILAVQALAGARAQEEDAPAPAPSAAEDPVKDLVKELSARVAALELEVRYLRSREAALTEGALRAGPVAAALERAVQLAREQGFEHSKIPMDSRVTLLRGIETHANDLRKSLPVVTPSETALLRSAEQERRAAGVGR